MDRGLGLHLEMWNNQMFCWGEKGLPPIVGLLFPSGRDIVCRKTLWPKLTHILIGSFEQQLIHYLVKFLGTVSRPKGNGRHQPTQRMLAWVVIDATLLWEQWKDWPPDLVLVLHNNEEWWCMIITGSGMSIEVMTALLSCDWWMAMTSFHDCIRRNNWQLAFYVVCFDVNFCIFWSIHTPPPPPNPPKRFSVMLAWSFSYFSICRSSLWIFMCWWYTPVARYYNHLETVRGRGSISCIHAGSLGCIEWNTFLFEWSNKSPYWGNPYHI